MKPKAKTLNEMRMDELKLRLAQFNGDKPKVADSFGVSLKTLYNWIHSDKALKEKYIVEQ